VKYSIRIFIFLFFSCSCSSNNHNKDSINASLKLENLNDSFRSDIVQNIDVLKNNSPLEDSSNTSINEPTQEKYSFPQNSSIIKIIYVEGLIEKFDPKAQKFLPLNNSDEISSESEIQLHENSFAILRLEDSKYLEIKGPIARTKAQNLFDFFPNNENKEAKSTWDKILEVIDYSSNEGFGEISGVTRGDGIGYYDENKYDFYISNEVKVLKGNDALIFWQPTKNYSSDYKLRISYTDFKEFKEKDTILSTYDTTLTISEKTINKCNPCEVEIISPKNSYNSPKIEMYSDELISDDLKSQIELIDSLIVDFPEIKLYQYAKIQLLIKNEFFATAHLLFKEYIAENDINTIDYNNFLKAIYKNYEY